MTQWFTDMTLEARKDFCIDEIGWRLNAEQKIDFCSQIYGDHHMAHDDVAKMCLKALRSVCPSYREEQVRFAGYILGEKWNSEESEAYVEGIC